jgi:hypothetical protein
VMIFRCGIYGVSVFSLSYLMGGWGLVFYNKSGRWPCSGSVPCGNGTLDEFRYGNSWFDRREALQGCCIDYGG